jgi:hypothetical protein
MAAASLGRLGACQLPVAVYTLRLGGVGSPWTRYVQRPVRGAAVLASALGCGAVVLLGCQLGRPKPGGGLGSADPIERVEAIIAAGEARDVSAVPLLVDRLEDEDEAVRFYAIQALTRITGQDMGYRCYEPSWERARAVRRWRGFVERRAASGPATRPAD